MPPRIPKACRQAPCKKTTTESHGYCVDHAHLASWGKHQQERGKSMYNSPAWRKVRKAIIKRDKGLCQECLKNGRVTPGTDCDHIIPVSAGGNKYSHSNIQLLCRKCHVAKTARD